MNRSALLSSLLLLTSACGVDRADEFRRAVPDADSVKVEVPGTSGQALTGSRTDGLEGDRSLFYGITRAVTVTVNGATVAVLGLLKAIVDHPPTTLDADAKVAVWGPHTEALSPNTYKLTVTRVEDGVYDYRLEAKGKTEADTAYQIILSGQHTVAADSAGNRLEKLGSGTFTIDWNRIQKLPEHDGNVGTADFTYSRKSPTADVKVDVAFHQVLDHASSQKFDARYAYLARPGNGGSFEFQVKKNLDVLPNRSAIETMTIKSRWLETGAGRSDVKAKGGDLQTEATASECWDPTFSSVFLDLSFDAARGYGQQSACAFSAAEFSALAL